MKRKTSTVCVFQTSKCISPDIYLQVLEVDDAVRPVLVRGTGKSQGGLELAVAPHRTHQPLVEISKHRRVVLDTIIFRRGGRS